jgi:hypothetical protein
MSHVLYASAIGSLMYTMVCTRPDIAHAMGVLSMYMSKPEEGALDNSKEGLQVFAWHYQLWIVLPRNTRIG